MAKILIDIEISLEAEQLSLFDDLAKEWGKTIPETIEKCMFEKRDEYLDMFKNNIPEEEKDSESKQTT